MDPALGHDPAQPTLGTTLRSAPDWRRLRAALRLLFDPGAADALASRVVIGDERTSAISALARAAERRHAFGRFTRHIPDVPASHPPGASPPLGPSSGTPSRAAVYLALHLGLGLDAEALADLEQDTPEHVGELLYRSRRAVTHVVAPCPEFAERIGRHRDRSLDPVARADLFLHVRECPACAAALRTFEELDAALLRQLAADLGTLPPLVPSSRRTSPLPAIGVAATLLVVVMLALAALTQGMRGPAAALPVPTPGAAAHTLSGWLLTTAIDGAVNAVDLQTGTVRPVAPSVPPGRFVRRMLSPDGRLIATWTPPYGPDGPEPTGTVTVRRLDGTTVRTWGLGGGPGPGAGSLVGWLGNSSLLVLETPPWQPTGSAPSGIGGSPLETRLVALDVQTSDARVLLQGSISLASASPDGTRVVVVQSYDRRYRGFTAQLRAVGPGGLGPPLVTAEHRLAPYSSVVGAPNSSRAYLAWIPGTEVAVPASAVGTDGVRSSPTTTAIEAVSRDGILTGVVAAAPGQILAPVSAAPGAARLVYDQQPASPAGSTARVWMTHPNGTPPTELAESAVPSGLNVAWLPDGGALLRDDLPFYLPNDPSERALGTVSWPVVLRVTPSGRTLPAATSAAGGAGWLGWVPAGTFPASATPSRATPRSPRVGQVQPAARPGALLGPDGAASADGRLVILGDASLPGGVIWDATSGVDSRVLRGAADLSWVPGTQTLIGVSGVGTQPGSGSRVTLYASRLDGAPSLDFRHFDPAGIGSATTRHYARPLVSPNGAAISVFVVNSTDDTAGLWLSTWRDGPRRIARWTATSPALGTIHPVATWVSADVLLYAEPFDWQHGLPQAVAIQQVTLGPDGAGTPATVAVVHAHGADRGIEVTDLAVSADGASIAWRVRHLTGTGTTTGRYDTIDVAPVANLSARLEIARATPGHGMAWSPDGRWLAVAIGGRVSLLSANGSVAIPVSPRGSPARYPVWVGPDQIWLSYASAGTPQTVRVRLAWP
ncbi:MAG TPA: hypothetical protein VFN57_06435 [Thermomicrobiaceae bacterium]|nr:hypothetical protein [Thermomicrobiaceae bacterium]